MSLLDGEFEFIESEVDSIVVDLEFGDGTEENDMTDIESGNAMGCCGCLSINLACLLVIT